MLAFRPFVALVALATPLTLGACAPTAPSALPQAEIGPAARVTGGTILSMRPVIAQAAGFAGGGDPRARILGAISGGIAGGVAGSAAEKALGTGNVVEFIIQEDGARQPISVVQTNQDNFAPGQRVLLTRGVRTRIARAGA